VEDQIEKLLPIPETTPFFISGHRLLPLRTKETPCKGEEEH
jgi:hypothetical protein